MANGQHPRWQKLTVTPEEVMAKLDPGMKIFLGTGVGEPRTLVKHLMADHASNLKDLELIQLVSLGDAISLEALNSNAYRLKTFYSGWVASEAITAGRVDLIPSSFSRIPRLIESGRIPIDVAFPGKAPDKRVVPSSCVATAGIETHKNVVSPIGGRVAGILAHKGVTVGRG